MAQGLSDPKTLKSADGTPLILDSGKILTKDSTVQELLAAVLGELHEIRLLIMEKS